MVTKIFDSLFLAINEIDLIFWQLIDGSGLMFVVIGVLFFALVYKFLLAPFFGGVISSGVSDSVQNYTTRVKTRHANRMRVREFKRNQRNNPNRLKRG